MADVLIEQMLTGFGITASESQQRALTALDRSAPPRMAIAKAVRPRTLVASGTANKERTMTGDPRGVAVHRRHRGAG